MLSTMLAVSSFAAAAEDISFAYSDINKIVKVKRSNKPKAARIAPLRMRVEHIPKSTVYPAYIETQNYKHELFTSRCPGVVATSNFTERSSDNIEYSTAIALVKACMLELSNSQLLEKQQNLKDLCELSRASGCSDPSVIEKLRALQGLVLYWKDGKMYMPDLLGNKVIEYGRSPRLELVPYVTENEGIQMLVHNPFDHYHFGDVPNWFLELERKEIPVTLSHHPWAEVMISGFQSAENVESKVIEDEPGGYAVVATEKAVVPPKGLAIVKAVLAITVKDPVEGCLKYVHRDLRYNFAVRIYNHSKSEMSFEDGICVAMLRVG